MPHRETYDTIVIGAGIIGITTTLTLQRAGYQVLLMDQAAPCSQTSFGNAGIFSTGSILTLNEKGLWRSVPGMLKPSALALRLSLRYALRERRALLRFLLAGEQPQADRRAAVLHDLIQSSLPLHTQWMREAGISHRRRETGWTKLYRSERAYRAAAHDRARYDAFGIEHTALSAADIQARFPTLNPVFAKGTWINSTQSVDDPYAVGMAYYRLFRASGGAFVQAAVTALQPRHTSHISATISSTSTSTSAGWQVQTADNTHYCERVVICGGFGSKALLKPLGIDLPLIAERGSHRLFYPEVTSMTDILPMPIYDVESSYVLSPMAGKLRLTSGVELSCPERPFGFQQLNRLEPIIRANFSVSLGTTHRTEDWTGVRPTLPDSVPAIGETKHPGLWLNVGHQHIGLTTAPGSAAALCQRIQANQSTPEDALSPARFGC